MKVDKRLIAEYMNINKYADHSEWTIGDFKVIQNKVGMINRVRIVSSGKKYLPPFVIKEANYPNIKSYIREHRFKKILQ